MKPTLFLLAAGMGSRYGGLAHNAYSKEIQNEVCLGDLFL